MSNLVGLFSNTKVTTLKVHAPTCSMLNTSNGKMRKVAMDGYTVVDMTERGFGVSYCKCCDKEDVKALKQAAIDHGPTGQY